MRAKAAVLFLLLPLVVRAGVLTMKEAVELALKNNPTYKAARISVLAAEERKKEAWAERLFTLSFKYSYTRFNEEQRVRLRPVEIPPLVPGMKPVVVKPGDVVTSRQNVYQYEFTFFQPLFTGGFLSSSYEMAKLGVDVERLREQEARLDLVFKVKEAYLNALKARKLLKVAKEAVRRLEAHYRDAKAFFEAGVTPKVDLLRAEVALSKARQKLVEAKASYKIALSALMILIGKRVDSEYELKDVLSYRPLGLSFSECLKRALLKRPVVLAVEKKVKMAKTAVRMAKSEYYPKIYLVGKYIKHGNTPECDGDGLTDAERWYVSGVLDWKFFEWGRTRHKVKRMNYEYLKALELKKDVENKVSLEVREAFLRLKSAEARIETARKEVAEAEKNYRDTRERYKEQIDTTTDVIDAETFLTEAETRYYTALYEYLVAYARLMRVMGELE